MAVPGVPEHGATMVADRLDDGERGVPDLPQRTLHLALVVPDLKQFHALRGSVFALHDSEHPEVRVKAHILLANPTKTQTEVVASHALITLGLIDPSITHLRYPEELEIGWNEPAHGRQPVT